MDFRDLEIKDSVNPFEGMLNGENVAPRPKITTEKKEFYLDYYSKLHNHGFPRLFPKSYFVVGSKETCDILGVDFETLASPANLPYLCGEKVHPNAYPFSSIYAGHQYGMYSIMGDGRTISLGRCNDYTIQIRGAGVTAYGVRKSGLLGLSLCVKEFIISECMQKLKIPTSNSIAVLGTPLSTEEGEFQESCGILSRCAPTWIRFGTFEYFHYRGELQIIQDMADYVIEKYYPEVLQKEGKDTLVTTRLISSELYDKKFESLGGGILVPRDDFDHIIGEPVTIYLNKYAIFLREVMRRTATLVAYWQAYGFVHGLLHTENFSIIGIGLNYEKSGFMDSYDPEWTPNIEDKEGRYRFEKQPEMAKWALTRLGQTLVDLIGDTLAKTYARPLTRAADTPREIMHYPEISAIPPKRTIPMDFLFNSSKAENLVREILQEFEDMFSQKYGKIMCEKLGLFTFEENDFEDLINPLLSIMATSGVDYTCFFRALSFFSCSETEFNKAIEFQPKGAHSVEKLRKSEQKECLGMVLKSLLKLRDEDSAFVQAEVKKLKDQGILPPQKLGTINEDGGEVTDRLRSSGYGYDPNIYPDTIPLSLPTLEEMAAEFKFWAATYRARLLSQNKVKGSTDINNDDQLRKVKLMAKNPKFVPRDYILNEVMKELKADMPLNTEKDMSNKKNANAEFNDHQNGEGASKYSYLKSVQKLLINDLFGKVAESKTNEDDMNLSSKWSKPPI